MKFDKIMRENRDAYWKKIIEESIEKIHSYLIEYQKQEGFVSDNYKIRLIAEREENYIIVSFYINDSETKCTVKFFFSGEAEIRIYLKKIQPFLIEENFSIDSVDEEFSEKEINEENNEKVILEMNLEL